MIVILVASWNGDSDATQPYDDDDSDSKNLVIMMQVMAGNRSGWCKWYQESGENDDGDDYCDIETLVISDIVTGGRLAMTMTLVTQEKDDNGKEQKL